VLIMRFGLTVPCFGVGVDAALIADWAGRAERSGWDGFFVWDHLFAFAPGPVDVVDPWIALAAAACGTTRIRLGTLVTPLPRRRPLVVARQTATLDRLSQGRLILGVGTGGGPHEWDYCGEEPDPRVRGEMLDEHLDLLSRLWTGEPVHFEGTHYRVAGPDWSGICFPPPVQSPRIPVWVGGAWPGGRPFTRAARWDGVAPIPASGGWTVRHTTTLVERIQLIRTSDEPFDVAVPGVSDPEDDLRRATFAEQEAAGATWWIEGIDPWRYGWTEGSTWPLRAMRDRIEAGP
jgi:alkanesulfonate monooxygenase SsuD/methylene tetrahydromethanopterin reductase-like flavin-dependent oxidoreductase (luciferase family)